jgi:5-formyltetrahydrofolate cyclo-ligase
MNESKNNLRILHSSIRQRFTPEELILKSKAICVRLSELLEKEDLIDKDILLYMPMFDEPDIINQCFADSLKDYRCFFPKTCKDGNLRFYRISDLSEMEAGVLNITEPVGNTEEYKGGKAIAVVPGIVFDINGNRIGHGKGYYDKFLSVYSDIKKIGVAFDENLIYNIPSEDHDVPMDIVVTDKRIINLEGADQ